MRSLPVPAPRAMLPLGSLPACGAVATFYVGADNRTGARIGPATVARILAAAGFDGFTLTDGAGFWKGTPEPSSVVSLAIPAPLPPDVAAVVADVARNLARAHRQECVAWTVGPACVGFADPRDA